MGCLCSKGISANEFVENHPGDKGPNKHQRAISSKKEEFRGKGNECGRGASARLITHDKAEENTGSTPILWDGGKKASVGGKTVRTATITDHFGTNDVARKRQLPKISNIPDGVEGAQVAAGWPSWLSAVAGEAIKGWIPRKADSFEKLYKIGQGTYSSVYRGRDLETGKIVAMKKVRFINMDPESVRFMAREIIILRRLSHPNVMKLDGLVTSRISGSLYLIFEYMEHDLAGLVATTGIQFTEAQIKCYMKQLLHGLEHCHTRGVLHRDIKGSNLLLDNDGNLKIGDFGLSMFSNTSQQKQPLTSRVVTLWYRPPELLLGSTDYGAEVDLWSSGCILAELFCGKPIMPGRTEVEQLHKIFKICGSPSEEYWRKAKLRHATIFKPQNPYPRRVDETFKDLPTPALALLDVLLAVEPDKRGSASSALQSQFFRTLPFPCDPAALPKYPPCKEFDIKLREDEARRKRAAGGKVRDTESSKRGLEEAKAGPAPDANAELHNSMQRWHGKTNPKSISEKFGPRQEDDVLDFGTDNSIKGMVQRDQCTRARLSNSVAVRAGSSLANSSFNGEKVMLQPEQSSRRHEWLHRLVDGASSGHKMGLQGGTPAKSIKGHVSRKNERVHYSGPLMPPGGNLEEMLKEHERQIQNAVRRAQQGKAKSKPPSGHPPAQHLVVGVMGV